MSLFSKFHVSWIVTLLAIVLVAASLRLIGLEKIPPGLYHDEAVNGLDALAVLQGQRLPIFFEANGGREPLFIYLQTFAVWVFGPSEWSLRIVAAVIGLLTIPVFFQLTRELSLPNVDATSLALVASAGLAVSYWHLHWSRIGLRAILLPLLLCLSFYFFLLARRTQFWRYTLLAGLFLGLSTYSYLAARLVPFIYLAFFALDWKYTARAWKQNAFFLIIAFIIALPLGIYFLQNPEVFSGRTGDIALASSANSSLLQALVINLARVAGMFFVQGDVEWRHGLALRPVLDPIAAFLFVVGLALSLKHWRTDSARLAWLVLIVMLLPTLLSQQAPDTLRAIGAAPIVFWFVAVGWTSVSSWLMARVGGTRAVWTGVGVVLLLIGSGFFTMRDYFFQWANDPRAYRDFDGEFTDIAHWVNQQSENVYLPIQIYAYPTVQFLTLARAKTLDSILNTDAAQLVRAQGVAVDGDHTDPKNQYVVISNGHVTPLNPSALPQLAFNEPLEGRFRILAKVGRVTGDPFALTRAPNLTPLRAEFEGLDLVGYEIDTYQVTHNGLGVTLYWQRVGSIGREPKVFLQVVDQKGSVMARADEFPTDGISITRYPLGQTIPDRHWIPIENKFAPGRYTLQVGLFDPLNGERWDAVVNGARDDVIVLGSVNVPLPATTIPPDAQQISAEWAKGISLDAYTVDTATMTAGDTSEWTLYWHTKQRLTRDLTVFVQLVNERGEIVAQADHDPLQGIYPTSIWEVGETIPDPFFLSIPAELPAADYTLYIGWYDRAINQRVVLQSPQAKDSALPLQTWSVR